MRPSLSGTGTSTSTRSSSVALAAATTAHAHAHAQISRSIWRGECCNNGIYGYLPTNIFMRQAGLINEILPAGAGFLPAVLERVREGMELAGDPSVRLKALRMYKGMLKAKAWRYGG